MINQIIDSVAGVKLLKMLSYDIISTINKVDWPKYRNEFAK